jgi:plasmid stability protein
MKNITVSVDDDLYRKARVRAAELDTSVSAVVRSFLVDFVRGATDFERRKALQDQTLSAIRSFRGNPRLTRDQVHDRDALR